MQGVVKSNMANAGSEASPSDQEISFPQLSTLGLEYLRRQRHYLIISLFYPFFTIVLQVFNTIFIIDVLNRFAGPLGGPSSPVHFQAPPLVDVLTPSIILIVLAIVAFVKLTYVFKLRKKVGAFEKQPRQDTFKEADLDEGTPNSPEEPEVALTDLFYDLADHIELLQKISIIFYIGCCVYLEWFIRYFLLQFTAFHMLPLFHNVVFWLNFADFIALILFLIVDVRQFVRWRKKLKRLHQYERRIYAEFKEK
jgi:hypothetical protein